MRLLIVGLISLLSASFSVNAANSFFYVGAAAQKQNVKLPSFTTTVEQIDGYTNIDFKSNSEGSPFRVFAGYQLNNYWAFEAAYTDYLTRGFTLQSNDIEGRVDLSGQSESMSVDLKALFTVPMTNRVSVRAGLGLAAWSNDTVALAGSASVPTTVELSETGVELLMGVGVSYAINKNIAVVLDWEKRSINSSGVDSIGLGLSFSL